MTTNEQVSAIAFLTDSATHGGAPVEVIETHVAVVVLAGDRAYKLKRAVAYAFLDFTTLEARRVACAAEVELNRRTAPELYLGVEPISRTTGGKLAIGGDGEPVDWLVVMRRFDQADLFDRMAAAGRLTAPLMRQLTDGIVAFHAAAAVHHDYGGHAGMAKIARDNMRVMRDNNDGLFDPERLDALESAWRRAIDGHDARLDARRAAGFVRWCHGDLHLRNICLLGGVPRPFDGIEFSAEIACVDVLYDLAFLLMDLAHRGHDELANQVFNRYFGRTEDMCGLPLLPLFLSLRAGVRAMVSVLEIAADPDRGEAHRRDAVEYLSLAEHLIAPRPAGLIGLGGVSGTGKSTIAADIAPDLGASPGALVLRSDVIRKTLFGVAPEEPLPDEAYTRHWSIRVYRRMRAMAKLTVAAGRVAIVDAVFTHDGERAMVAAIAARAGVRFIGLWLEAPADILRARVEARLREGADASDADVSILERQLTYDAANVEWVRVDTSDGPTAVCERVREALIDGGFTEARIDGNET